MVFGVIKHFTLKLTTLELAIKKMKELLVSKPGQDWTLTVVEKSDKRSIPANRAYQSWYPDMADQLAMTILECTCFVKLNFGLPILLSNEYFNDLIGDSLRDKGFFELSYEDRIAHMIKLPVTRLFDTPMHKRLRDDLQNHFGAMGLNLDYRK